LRKLIELELIEESDERPAPELDDARRRYYRLTSLGRRVLAAESQRLRELVRLIDGKRGLTNRSGACSMKNVTEFSIPLYRRLARSYPDDFSRAAATTWCSFLKISFVKLPHARACAIFSRGSRACCPILFGAS
jgi:hypothetical protein